MITVVHFTNITEYEVADNASILFLKLTANKSKTQLTFYHLEQMSQLVHLKRAISMGWRAVYGRLNA